MNTLRTFLALLWIVGLGACTGAIDEDGDGFEASVDCDDAVASTHPGATEVCDGVDNDCDGDVDEEAADASPWYRDGDGDGYGDPAVEVLACQAPSGHVASADDCDDSDAAYHPGAPEDDCTDPEDYNCDGSVGYADVDGDGYAACEECDDQDPDINPGATEVCDEVDNDCDGTVDEDDAADAPTWYADADADGYGDADRSTTACEQEEGWVGDDTDCDDTDPHTHPGADETCDEEDDDCDGEVDEDATDAPTWYRDSDEDGYGDTSVTLAECDQPSGYVSDATDCDDADADAHPGADEYCDGHDDDCDGDVDEDDAVDASTWYADDDGDGYGDADTTDTACDQPSDYVSDDSDCDDTDADTHPGADEYCDGHDDDCDGTTDEDDAVDASTWYLDSDGDGYGDASTTDAACSQPSGYLSDDTDCDDSVDTTHPGAAESESSTACMSDADLDGYGDDSPSSSAVIAGTDCDDTDADVNPGETEVCNEIDDDCDGTVDGSDASDASTWYADADADGYGDSATTELECDQPSGYVSDSTDCDDGDADTHPGADEYCDGHDDDCDGTTDEDDAVDASTWYADSDGDGFGDASTTDTACSAPSGYVSDATDCDDGDADTHPDADEYCDGHDDDCDGTTDEDDAVDASSWYVDSDGDGYGDGSSTTTACSEPSGYLSDGTDCDDTDADIHPGATEICVDGCGADGVDDDCDGSADDGCPTLHDGINASTDETWSAGEHHIECSYWVQGSASASPTLTIEDGATVTFGSGAYLNMGSSLYSADLVVEGTVSGVVFTSAEASPAAGDWRGLIIQNTAGGTLIEGAEISYGGSGYANLTLYDEATVTDTVLSDSGNYGLMTAASDALLTDVEITDSADEGLYCLASAPCLDPTSSGIVLDGNGGTYAAVLDAKSVPALADATFTSNTGAGIFIDYDGAIDTDLTWSDVGEDYYVEKTLDLEVDGATFTVEDGVTIYFGSWVYQMIHVGGTTAGDLVVDGHTSGVTFSSAATTPGAGDWGGILLADTDGATSIDGLTLEYAGSGWNSYASIVVEDAATVSDSAITDGGGDGIYVDPAGSLAISGTELSGHTDDGLVVEGELSSFSANTLTGNGAYPITLPLSEVDQLDTASTYTGNTTDQLVLGGGTLDSDTTLYDLGLPYRVDDTIYVEGSAAPLLTVSDGVELYFDSLTGLVIGEGDYGDLDLDGDTTTGSGIILDASGTYWLGLEFGANATASSLAGFTLGGAGSYSSHPMAISLSGSTVDLSDCTIEDSEGAGVYLSPGTLTITDCTIQTIAANSTHDGYGLYASTHSSNDLTLSAVTITGNDSYPLVLSPNQLLGVDGASSTYSGNGEDYIYVRSGTANVSGSWPVADVPIFVDKAIYVRDTSSATTPTVSVDGADIVIADGGYIDAGSYYPGELVVSNTTFSRYSTSGYWGCVRLGSSTTSTSSITSSTFEYGGWGICGSGSSGYAMVGLGGAGSFNGNAVNYGYEYGVLCSGYAGPDDPAVDNSFTGNGLGDTTGC